MTETTLLIPFVDNPEAPDIATSGAVSWRGTDNRAPQAKLLVGPNENGSNKKTLMDIFRNGSPKKIAATRELASLAAICASMELCLAIDFHDHPEWHKSINRQLREWLAVRIEAGQPCAPSWFKPDLAQIPENREGPMDGLKEVLLEPALLYEGLRGGGVELEDDKGCSPSAPMAQIWG